MKPNDATSSTVAPFYIGRRHFLQALTAGAAALALPESLVSAATDCGILLGVCTSLKKQALLKQTGFDFIEENVSSTFMPKATDEEFAKKLADIKAASLPIRSCTGFIPKEIKVVGPDVNMDAAVQYATIVLRRAGQIKMPRVVFGSGGSRQVPEGFDHAKAKDQFIAFCKKIAPIAADNNVVIVLEPLNKGECNFMNRVSEGLEFVAAIDHPAVQQHADIFHMLREDEGPESIIKGGKHIMHCHIAEKANRTAPGIAGDDFRPYFKALKAIGYKGGVSIEGKWKDDQLAKALQVMTEQIKTA